ncbi:hypothetical protein VTI74DRAFT_8318 [Chaetomium olivicolor]
MTALFNEKFSADTHLVASQTAACRGALLTTTNTTTTLASCSVAALAFPSLAARFGIAPAPFAEAEKLLATGLGINLVPGQGRFAGSTVTRAEYEAYVATLPVAAEQQQHAREAACLEFFKHYAFAVAGHSPSGGAPLVTATREACVYLLGSLINHCCTPPPGARARGPKGCCFPGGHGSPSGGCGSSINPVGPNCSWRIGPSGLAHFVKQRHICVQARRAIRKGEQLTWDYGKREKGFECECETCQESFMGIWGAFCKVL